MLPLPFPVFLCSAFALRVPPRLKTDCLAPFPTTLQVLYMSEGNCVLLSVLRT